MNYSGIAECDVLNGTGFRTVLFVSGCSHHCYKCHNKNTWDINYGHKYTNITKEYILNCCAKEYIDGLTLSGGDPLNDNNVEDLYILIKEFKVKFPNKNIWIYSGYTWEEIRNSNDTKEDNLRKCIIKLCNVFVDGRFELDKRDVTLKFRGSSNQRLIDVQKSLKENRIIEVI